MGASDRSSGGTAIGEKHAANLLFVLPYLLILLVLLLVPLGLGIWLSFQDYDMLGGWNGSVGLDNFRNLLDDSIFSGTVRNTVVFVLITTPAFVGLGLFLALALNDSLHRSAVLRTVFFGSSVLSVTIVTLIWRLVYLPDRGLAADVLGLVGLHGFDPVTSETWALPAIALVTVWWIIGLPMTLFLAALQQIPAELYEAAALDHASRFTTLRSITLPSIRRTIAVVAVIEIVLQFQLFGQALLITGGGPNNTRARSCSLSTRPASVTSNSASPLPPRKCCSRSCYWPRSGRCGSRAGVRVELGKLAQRTFLG